MGSDAARPGESRLRPGPGRDAAGARSAGGLGCVCLEANEAGRHCWQKMASLRVCSDACVWRRRRMRALGLGCRLAWLATRKDVELADSLVSVLFWTSAVYSCECGTSTCRRVTEAFCICMGGHRYRCVRAEARQGTGGCRDTRQSVTSLSPRVFQCFILVQKGFGSRNHHSRCMHSKTFAKIVITRKLGKGCFQKIVLIASL